MSIMQRQGQVPAFQNAADDPALKNALEFSSLIKTLGLSLQVRDNNLNMIAGKFNSVTDLFSSPEFLSRLDQILYLNDATGTIWIELAIKKGKIASFSMVLSMKIQWAVLYKQGGGNADILYVGYTAGADSKNVTTALPLTDFRPERIPKYFPFAVGETAHDSKEIGKLICYLLSPYINNPDPKAIREHGEKQGFWPNISKKIQFNPPYHIPIPVQKYVPKGLLCRENPCAAENDSAEDITPLLVPLFAGKKRNLIALLIRITSFFLFLFAAMGIFADNIFSVKLSPTFSIHWLISIFRNTRYNSLEAPPIGPNFKPLRFELETVNDGVVVIVDTFAADQLKKAEKGYDLLVQDVCGAAGSSSAVHHIIALISGYADLYLPRDKYCMLKLDEDLPACSPSYCRTALKRLDASLICKIERGCNNGNLGKTFRQHVDNVRSNIPETIPVSKRNTYVMLVTSLRMYREFYSPLFTPDFERDIEAWLTSQEQERQPISDSICAEFGKILNKKIADGFFRLVLKEDVTPFDKGTHTIIVDRQNRRIDCEPVDSFAIARNEMQTINDTDSLTTALYELGYLPHTAKDEKSIRVTICNTDDDEHHKLYFHALGFDLISHENLQRFDLIDKQQFLFQHDELPTENFLPLVKTVDGRFAGKMLVYQGEENNHYFGTGKPGAGKSWAIAQILSMLFMLGHNVIVFDVSRTYTKEKLYKMFPSHPEVVDNLFRFISVGCGMERIPVDLGLLKDCNTLPDKKKVIYSTLVAALGKTDPDKAIASRKKKALQHFLSDYLRDKTDSVDFVDMLTQMEHDGRVDTDIIDTLADILGEIDEIGCDGISWGDLFEREKRIIVIDLGNEVGDDTHVLLDILAASLINWQMLHDSKFLDIAVDELKDQNFAPNSILRTIVSDGRRFHTAIIGATQFYFDSRHPQLDAMRQAGIKSFGRPGKSADKIAQELGYDNAEAAGFNKFTHGDVILELDAFNKETGANEPITLRGRVVDFVDTPLYERFMLDHQIADPSAKADEFPTPADASRPEGAEDPTGETVPASQILSDIPLPSSAADEMELTPLTKEEQSQPPDTNETEVLDEVPETGSSEDVKLDPLDCSTQESTEVKAENIPETDEQPLSPNSEPEGTEQERIEEELQGEFRSLISHFSPDAPSWESDLADLLARIMEMHCFPRQVDRSIMQVNLRWFMNISPDRCDYRERLEDLFHSIWPIE